MTICAMFNCDSSNQKNLKRNRDRPPGELKFFSFPKNEEISRIWVEKCGRRDPINVKHARVCSKHFGADQYARNLKYELLNYMPNRVRGLKPDAVPTLHLPGEEDKQTKREHKTKNTLFKFETVIINEQPEPEIIERDEQEDDVQYQDQEELSDAFNESESVQESTIEIECLGPIRESTIEIERKDKQCNTEPIRFLEKSHMEVLLNSDKLQLEVDKLKAKCAQLELDLKKISVFLSPCQRAKLLKSDAYFKGRVQWSEEDITRSHSLYRSGPKAYEMLLLRGYPLPAVVTLKKWAAKNGCEESRPKKNIKDKNDQEAEHNYTILYE